jgi:thiamine kinase-like enzyme
MHFFFDIDAYLMESIEGVNFFQISESERIKKIRLAGKTLALAYTNQNGNDKMDISKEIEKSFKRYRETRKRFFLEEELRLPKSFFKIFEGVPKTMSHNDLNAANLLFPDSGIKLIDPSEEGYFDIARDIGRYSASCFFNHFDYFGQDKEKSIEIAREFLGFFDEKILSRARYYIAESFLSFLNFETKTVSKNVLKRLSVNMFLKDGEIVKTLEESI